MRRFPKTWRESPTPGSKKRSAQRTLLGLDQVWDQARDSDASVMDAAYQVAGVAFYDVSGAMDLYHAITGEDPVTLQKYTAYERVVSGVTGTVKLVSLAVAGAKLLNSLRGPCGGYIFRRCFVAGTQVVLRENPAYGTSEVWTDQDSSTSENGLTKIGCLILFAGLAGGAALAYTEKKKKHRPKGLIRGHEPVDDVFSGTEWEKTMDRSFGLETEPETSEGGVATFPQVRNRQDIAVQPASKPDVAIMSPKPMWKLPSLASFVMILGLLFGGGCLLPGLFSTGNEKLFQEEEVPRFITKNIEDVEEGDYVLARDEFGNDIGLRRVVEVYRRTSDHLRILTFQADDGTQQTLETTNEHPFWVVGDETFTEAKNLKVGTKVTSPHGELQTLVSTVYEARPEGIAVFNFQVEGYHTYYVREHGTRGPPVLVHNADYDPPQKTYQTYKKTNPKTGEVYHGRTSGTGTPAQNLTARDRNHHMNDQGFGPAVLDKSSSNYNAIRGREQQLIEASGGAKSLGGTSGNAINGIGANNKKAQQYLDAADDEFGSL